MTTGTAAKTERLLNLTIALLSTARPLRKAQIRAAVPQYADCHGDGAFDRMFERDKDELRAIGVPLLTVAGDDWLDSEDAYRIDASIYALPEVDLTPAELAVLGLAARMWDQATVGAAARRAVGKLQALGIEADLEAVTGAAPRVSAAEPGFEPLYRATRERYPVSFGYRAAGADAITVRTVEPWTLALRRGVWYLACFDRHRRAARVFRLSRMTGPWRRAGAPGSAPVPDPDAVTGCLANLDRPWCPPADEGLAVLWVRPGAAPRLRRSATPQRAAAPAPPPDRDAVTVPFTDTEWLAAEIAGYGGDVIVAGPDALRDAVARRWRSAIQRHSGTAATWPVVPPGTAPVEATVTPAGRPPAITAVDRLSRLLAMVPYLLARPGIELARAAAHFAVTEDQVVADLELLFVCGTPGHLPDDLIEADWAGGVVSVGNADAIARPLRLSSEEAIALLVGLDILAGIPGPHDKDAVTGARRAIAGVLGSDTPGGHDATVPVTFIGDPTTAAASGVTEAVVAGLRHRRVVRLRYLSAARDRITERDVDPLQLMHADGRDYLRGWCHTAGEVRTFRLDRILHADVLDRPVQPGAGGTPMSPSALPMSPRSAPSAGDVEVTLRLRAGHEWIAEYFHATARAVDGDATIAVLVLGQARVERLALGSDGAVEVLAPQRVRAAVAARAATAPAHH